MNIIVLGNGFDLAHGLPTRYTDFLKYCRDYDNKQKLISNDTEAQNEFAESIKENIWLSYFLINTPNLDEDRTWIDFETEILNVIQGMSPVEWVGTRRIIDTPRTCKTLTREEFVIGQYGMFMSYLLFANEESEYTTSVNYEPVPPKIDVEGLYSQLRKFTRAFELYCSLVINEKCGIRKRYELNESLLSLSSTIDSNQVTYIVSFNYTRTFNRFYDCGERKSPISYTYVYPHGEACADVTLESAYNGFVTSGLVLGTQSFDHENKDYYIPATFNVFQKHNQQHRYSTLADFQHLLIKLRESSSNENNESVNIYIVGHSLDKSDHAKLKHLFTENKNARITVFYHDEIAFQQYINNITDILGESDVAVRVRFFHQNNQTYGLLLPYRTFEDGRVSYDVIDSPKDQISSILSDYFLNNNEIPCSLNEVSTNTAIRAATVNTIENIELHENQAVVVRGSGYIEVDPQISAGNDLGREDGDISNKTFPLKFTLKLRIENLTSKPEYERYLLDDIDYRIDS